MAIKALLLKKEIDGKRSALAKLEERNAEFETRKADLEKALAEMTDEAPAEQRDAVAEAVSQFDAEEAEHKEKVSNLRQEIENLEKELEEEEEAQEVPEDKTPEERNKKMDEIITRNSKEYIDKYAEYIKGNIDANELRTVLKTENASGTVAVPEFVYDVIKTAWENEEIMSLVKKSYVRGNLKVGFEISSDGAVIHTEGAAAIDPENIVLGIVELVPASIKKVVQVSDEALDMGGEAFLRYIYAEITHKIAKKAADTLIEKIIASPQTSTTTAPQVGVVTSTTISLSLVAQAMAKLSDEASKPVVIMNKATWGSFKAAQAEGNFAYDPFEGLAVKFSNKVTAFSAATTGVCYAIVGDLGEGALANFPNGDEITLTVDRLSLKKQDLVEILGREYVAVGVVAPDAFVMIKH